MSAEFHALLCSFLLSDIVEYHMGTNGILSDNETKKLELALDVFEHRKDTLTNFRSSAAAGSEKYEDTSRWINEADDMIKCFQDKLKDTIIFVTSTKPKSVAISYTAEYYPKMVSSYRAAASGKPNSPNPERVGKVNRNNGFGRVSEPEDDASCGSASCVEHFDVDTESDDGGRPDTNYDLESGADDFESVDDNGNEPSDDGNEFRGADLALG
ncbi:hypothetical protein F4811DRAFT_552246 [Daldinia bambusicola]|nr:hypothetical protein F4811DRAFT_552246 [Daldinia bambusicola]